MKKKHILFSAILVAGMGMVTTSCSDFLEVQGKLGENNQSIERIFESEEWTEQWLAQAYVWMTWENSDINGKDFCITNFADDMCYGDRNLEYRYFKYAEYGEDWKQACWRQAYQGIRQASIFIDNIDRNKHFTDSERIDMKGQARFVRAYLYWKLLQKYGPIPLIPEEGLDYTGSYESLAVPRSSYDECADFIAEQMRLAALELDLKRDPRNVARPTRGAALATRAKVLLYAASPINNPGGPSDPIPGERFADLVDDQNRPLMGQVYDEMKWARAAAAARDVVEMGREGVYRLYTSSLIPAGSGSEDYPVTVIPPYDQRYSNNDFPNGWANIDPLQSYKKMFNGDVYVSDNPEMIFTTAKNDGGQSLGNALTKHQMPVEGEGYNCHAMTGKQCDAYETNLGQTFDKNNRPAGYVTLEDMKANKYPELGEYYGDATYYEKGVGVSLQYVQREPRFYASCAYNGCFWPMSSAEKLEDRYKQVWYYRGKNSGWANTDRWLPTGIGIMKYVSPRDNSRTGGTISFKASLNIRYADVLLWYAEALNELSGNSYQIASWDGTKTYTISRDPQEMSYAVSQVRIRGGVPDYDQGIYNSQEEFRKKIKHERQIEFFEENSRYFDLRRWKDADAEESLQIYGCNPKMPETDKDLYHTMVTISNLPTTFNRKMYFWPIQHDELRKNSRLTQNPGWTTYD